MEVFLFYLRFGDDHHFCSKSCKSNVGWCWELYKEQKERGHSTRDTFSCHLWKCGYLSIIVYKLEDLEINLALLTIHVNNRLNVTAVNSWILHCGYGPQGVGVLESIFAGYVPLASQNHHSTIIVYSVAKQKNPRWMKSLLSKWNFQNPNCM